MFCWGGGRWITIRCQYQENVVPEVKGEGGNLPRVSRSLYRRSRRAMFFGRWIEMRCKYQENLFRRRGYRVNSFAEK